MSGSTMPDDVRAKIAALFPARTPSPEQLRAASLAGLPDRPASSLPQLLARIDAQNPALGDYARWIIETGGPPGPADRATLEREVWTTVAALRVLSYRRESAALEVYLDDPPTDARARQRVLDLVVAVRDIERRYPGATQRAQLAQAREAGPPVPRKPLANHDDEETR